MSKARHFPRLSDLGLFARFGVAMIVLAMLGGTAASGFYLYIHHKKRDLEKDFTIDDVIAHYHGIVTPAPLTAALQAGHPSDLGTRADGTPWLTDDDRAALLAWLNGPADQLEGNYENDEQEVIPADIVFASCISCHSRGSTVENAAPSMPLQTPADVLALARGRDVRPMSVEILATSTHTHALGMASMGLIMATLALMTGWYRWVTGFVVGLAGLGLFADLACWWLIRDWDWGLLTGYPDLAWVIVVGGGLFNGGIGVMGLLILLDLVFLPGKREAAAA